MKLSPVEPVRYIPVRPVFTPYSTSRSIISSLSRPALSPLLKNGVYMAEYAPAMPAKRAPSGTGSVLGGTDLVPSALAAAPTPAARAVPMNVLLLVSINPFLLSLLVC